MIAPVLSNLFLSLLHVRFCHQIHSDHVLLLLNWLRCGAREVGGTEDSITGNNHFKRTCLEHGFHLWEKIHTICQKQIPHEFINSLYIYLIEIKLWRYLQDSSFLTEKQTNACFITVCHVLIHFFCQGLNEVVRHWLRMVVLKILEDIELIFSFRLGKKTGPRSWMYRQTGPYELISAILGLRYRLMGHSCKRKCTFLFHTVCQMQLKLKNFWYWVVKFKGKWFCYFDISVW